MFAEKLQDFLSNVRLQNRFKIANLMQDRILNAILYILVARLHINENLQYNYKISCWMQDCMLNERLHVKCKIACI